LTAALFGAATLLIDGRPVPAGLLFGMLCYKPHLGLLIPVALAAGRRWRAFTAAVAAVLGLCAFSAVLFGVDTWSLLQNSYRCGNSTEPEDQVGQG
jgi:hypothetical protein